MEYIKALIKLFDILGVVIGWFKERDDEKRKKKAEVLKEVISAKTQKEMQNAINDFNAL